MKIILTVASLIATLLFAGLWLAERQQARAFHRQLASLEQKVREQSDRLETGQRTIDGLKVQRADLSWEIGNLQLQVRALRSATNVSAAAPATAAQSDASSRGPKPGMEKFISEMLKSPEMKKMMQQQQKGMMLNQFTNANSVNEEQTRQLLEMMKEERRRAMAEAGEPKEGSQQVRDLQALASEEELNKLVQRQELVNARVLERAKAILAPEQMEAFGKFQANQIEMQRMSMNMARAMFGGGKPGGGTSPPETKR